MSHAKAHAPIQRYGPDDRPVLARPSENAWIVGGSHDPRQNGYELLAAYAAAKRARPYRQALSATNRLSLLLLPGTYALSSRTLVMDANFIDIVGISPNTGQQAAANWPFDTGDTVISSIGATATISLTAGSTMNLRLQNLCIITSNASAVAIKLTNTLNAPMIWRNLLIVNTSSSSNAALSTGMTWAGYFEDVRCWNDSTWDYFSGVCSGYWLRCKTGGYSFGATASGTFIDCEADGVSFGNTTASGVFIRCRYVNVHGVSGGMFGAGNTASGKFIDCISIDIDGSFGGITASGFFKNCRSNVPTPAGRFFGPYTGVFSGVAEGCVGGNYSFASNGTFSGTARWCRITHTTNPFLPATFTGTILYCDFPGWFDRPALTDRAADLTLIPSDNGNLFTNRGATGQIIYTLPVPQVGMNFRFFVVAAQNLRIVATTGVTIRIGAGVTAAAGHIDNATTGGYVELTALSTTQWYGVEGVAGAWTLT